MQHPSQPSAVLPTQAEASVLADHQASGEAAEENSLLHHSSIVMHHSRGRSLVAGIGNSPQQGAGNADCAVAQSLLPGEPEQLSSRPLEAPTLLDRY